MSVFREQKPIDEKDNFTVEDSYIVRDLLESGKLTKRKLTEREQLAVQRLYRTWDYMTS